MLSQPCTAKPSLSLLLLLFAAVLPLSDCREQSNLARQPVPPGALSSSNSPAGLSPSVAPSSPASIPTYTYEVVNSWPHDRSAFTQGLVFHQGSLYESTGLHGSSSLRQVELASGKVLRKLDIANQYFAEGMTIFDNKIFLLTWQSHKGFVYDLSSFSLLNEFAYEGEGWGLTHDNQYLIMSDGTNRLRFLDPATFRVERTVDVYYNQVPLTMLNELEYINGEIYANIWQTNRIVRIDPNSGKVLGSIDLTGLLPRGEQQQSADVLNGIAFDEGGNRLFVTGKLWPKIFELRLRKQ